MDKCKLLEHVGTVEIPATSSRFVARRKFVVGTNHDAPVKILSVCADFFRWFLEGKGKVEEPITARTLHYSRMCTCTEDGPIINEIGGYKKAKTTLSEIFFLMENPMCRKRRILLKGTLEGNLFFVKDRRGVLRAVSLLWDYDGWDVVASRIKVPALYDDRRVFHRAYITKSSGTLAPSQV